MTSRLTYAQLEGLWIKAGGQKSLAPLMAAIAEAESGGNPQALNPSDNNGTQSSFGLWQISNGTHTPPSPNWANPLTNAQLAVGKLKSQGLGAWGTYSSGAYKAYLSNSTTPTTSGISTTANPGPGQLKQSYKQSLVQRQCLIRFPGVGGIGATCLFSKGNARAIIGGLALGAGGLIAFAGIAILAAQGFERTGAARALDALTTRIDAPVPKIAKAPKPKKLQAPKGALPPGKKPKTQANPPAAAPASTPSPAPRGATRTPPGQVRGGRYRGTSSRTAVGSPPAKPVIRPQFVGGKLVVPP